MTTKDNYKRRFAVAAKKLTPEEHIHINDCINLLHEVGLLTRKERDKTVMRHNEWLREIK